MNKDTISFLAVIVMTALLKLANVQPFSNWNWLWLLSPLWITIGIGVLLITIKNGIGNVKN